MTPHRGIAVGDAGKKARRPAPVLEETLEIIRRGANPRTRREPSEKLGIRGLTHVGRKPHTLEPYTSELTAAPAELRATAAAQLCDHVSRRPSHSITHL